MQPACASAAASPAAIAQFQGIERPVLSQFARQGIKKRRQPLDQCALLVDQFPWQGRDLEHQRPGLGAQPLQAGHDELARGDRGIEKMRIGYPPPPVLTAHQGIETVAGALTRKLKLSGTSAAYLAYWAAEIGA